MKPLLATLLILTGCKTADVREEIDPKVLTYAETYIICFEGKDYIVGDGLLIEKIDSKRC